MVPMLQALLAFDLDSLWAALRQDAVILLACAAAALALWRATAFRLEDGAVKAERRARFTAAITPSAEPASRRWRSPALCTAACWAQAV
ncbi:MAG: hypothetical protein V8T36_12325 [Ruthenibacterium lactatiformans]